MAKESQQDAHEQVPVGAPLVDRSTEESGNSELDPAILQSEGAASTAEDPTPVHAAEQKQPAAGREVTENRGVDNAPRHAAKPQPFDDFSRESESGLGNDGRRQPSDEEDDHKRRKALARFLQGVDVRGKRDSKPGWGFLIFGVALLAGFIVAGCARGGAQGVAISVIAGVILVLWVLVGLYVTHSLFSHYDGSLLSQSERDALAGLGDQRLLRHASHVMSVGPLLARATRELPWGEHTKLTSAEIQTIEENRKSEAKLTEQWRESVGELTPVSIVADDGILLVAHVLECAPASNRWVVLAHDYHGHWNEMLLYARSYAQRGFNLLIPEMRAHGSSEGNIIGMGWLDRLDLIDWCRWIATNKNEQARIVLHGHSMGGVAVCLAACDKLLPSGVLAAVVDSPYSDAWNMITRVLRGCHLPVRPMAQMVRLLLMLNPGGYDLADASAVHAVEHAQVPTLIIHGEKDTMVPPYMSKKTYDHVSGSASGDNSRLHMFPHAGHCQALLSDPKTYYHEVFSFLKPRV